MREVGVLRMTVAKCEAEQCARSVRLAGGKHEGMFPVHMDECCVLC